MKQNKPESFWLNLGCNIVAPSVLLIKGADIAKRIGLDCADLDLAVFLLAMAFPVVYGIADFAARRRWNLFSAIGFLSVLLTGGIGLLSLSREWIIVKEGAVPLVLGFAVLITAWTKRPLAKMIVLSESVFDVRKVEAALRERGAQAEFDAKMKSITYIIAASFLLSSALNFLLASIIFRSPAGTPEFNEQLGTMTALSFPVIVLPTMAVFIFALLKFFRALESLAGLSLEEITLKK